MKKIALIFLLVLFTTRMHADPEYILLKTSWLGFGGFKFKVITDPEKRKRGKWCYDRRSDAYYRIVTVYGIEARLNCDDTTGIVGSPSQLSNHPDYIVFGGSPLHIMHVNKPTKKLHKWYYYAQKDTYYRIESSLGIRYRIK